MPIPSDCDLAAFLVALQDKEPLGPVFPGEDIVLHCADKRQAAGQGWCSHLSIVKSTSDPLRPFHLVALHESLSESLCFKNTFDYWTVAFTSLGEAAQAFCAVDAIGTPYLEEVVYDEQANVFIHRPHPGRLEFERDLARLNAEKRAASAPAPSSAFV